MVKTIFKWIGIILCALLIIFVVILMIPERETVAPITPRENTEYWQMGEGFSIAYTHLKEDSSNQREPVVYLHGGPGGYIHSSVIETLDELTSLGHDVYLYDQRGSGLSDRLSKFSNVSFEKHLGDLDEIISTHIGAEKVILIGQSFGAGIASHYSAYHPEKVSKLIFSSPGELRPPRKENGHYVDMDSLYTVPDSLEFIEPYNFVGTVNATAAKPKAIAATFGALLFDQKWVSDKQMDRMLNTLASGFTKGMVCDPENVQPEEGGGGLYAYLATNNHDMEDVRDKIRDLQIPALVIQGQCDYIPYSSAYEYVDLYPNSEYAFIKNAGHDIWWEQKEEYLKVIKAFLESSGQRK